LNFLLIMHFSHDVQPSAYSPPSTSRPQHSHSPQSPAIPMQTYAIYGQENDSNLANLQALKLHTFLVRDNTRRVQICLSPQNQCLLLHQVFDLTDYQKEVKKLESLGRHPELTRFLGRYDNRQIYLTEYSRIGSLKAFLARATQQGVRTDLLEATRLLADLAHAMAKLQQLAADGVGGGQPFYHGDLRAESILLSDAMEVKIDMSRSQWATGLKKLI
jgi:hypothetical protein